MWVSETETGTRKERRPKERRRRKGSSEIKVDNKSLYSASFKRHKGEVYFIVKKAEVTLVLTLFHIYILFTRVKVLQQSISPNRKKHLEPQRRQEKRS